MPNCHYPAQRLHPKGLPFRAATDGESISARVVCKRIDQPLNDIYVCGRGESAFVLFAPTASDFLSQLVELHRARSVPRRTGGLGTRLKRPGS